MISSSKGVPHHERLRILNLTTLDVRRVRGDLIQVFKPLYMALIIWNLMISSDLLLVETLEVIVSNFKKFVADWPMFGKISFLRGLSMSGMDCLNQLSCQIV